MTALILNLGQTMSFIDRLCNRINNLTEFESNRLTLTVCLVLAGVLAVAVLIELFFGARPA